MRSTTERRQLMIEALCQRRHDTVERLAMEFGVSERTVRYDLEVLSCTYPLYTQKGNGGGVFVSEGYRLGMKYLTQEQAALLKELSNTLDGDKLKIMQDILSVFQKPPL